MNQNKGPIESVFGIFNKLSLQQKVLIGGLFGVTIVLFVLTIFYLNKPTFSILYTGLAPADASKVIEELAAQNIEYSIEGNGQTIKVPEEKVYELRLSLASKGIPSSGVIGYEIFDKNTMGMSEFMQKLNYKRALEGELSRTIIQQEGIEGARVHIVTPQRSVFRDEEKFPTASVVLKLSGNSSLSKQNIQAISNLISSSVEGLEPSRVTILDTKGRLLSRESDESGFSGSSQKNYEVKQQIENYLAMKAQSILDNVLGVGNSIVQINADVDFSQVEKTMELYDPESQVAVSEQTVRSENSGMTITDTTAQLNENTTTNYEISKTIQRVVEASGSIRRLSVAVVINDVAREVTEGETVKTVFEPRQPEQLVKLEEIVKNAVGIDPERNDQFSLVNISFETRELEEIKEEQASFLHNNEELINLILILAAISASFILLKGLMKRLKNEKILIGTVNTGYYDLQDKVSINTESSKPSLTNAIKRKKIPLPIGDIEDEISDEAIRKKTQQEKISNYVSKNPADAAKLINAWLHEEES
ncbi:MAG: flagellar M-ring protein FliF [Chlorobiaceae bacterium]|nr:flagellar M-ring protein FliF [Chlorobiaceae bacterium]MBA4310965.1 flagellar M-ring protein FliF [Chlorobiaceae bacterium]